MYSNYTRLSKTRGVAGTNYAKFFQPGDNIYNEPSKDNHEGTYQYTEFYNKEGGGCNNKKININKQKDIVKRLILLEENLAHSSTVNKDYIIRQCLITESLLDESSVDEILKEKFRRISNSLFYDAKNNSLDGNKCYSYVRSIKDVRVSLIDKI